MQPIEQVLSRLPDRKETGAGFSACCPAHDDHSPSLSIKEAEDGAVLLKCFAGCSTEQVVAALGLRTADLFPTTKNLAPALASRPAPSSFATAEDAVAAYRRGEPDRQWVYLDAEGNEVGRTLRWNSPEGKVIRPIARSPGGWRTSAMIAPRPLFNLPGLLADEAAAVFVVEGEKCVDSLASLGLPATTSAGGSEAANKSDWSPLAGRDVIILPDNDEAGRRYAEDVRRILGGLQAKVRICCLDGLLDEGKDVADLVGRCIDETQRSALRNTIEQAASQASPCPVDVASQDSPLADNPFPTDALPEIVRCVVIQAAKSIGCDEAAIALPCLTGLGVACANLRVMVKEDWTAPPAVWSVIARPSGQQKSPALDVTLDYFRRRQEDLCLSHSPQPKKGEQDRPPTVWTDNATTEGLDDAFRRNPRGVLYGCDELSGWLGTFGLYKNGRGTADEGWYCQRYSGRASNFVRKHGSPHSGCASGVLGIAGCTTVETLKSLLTGSVRDCGMMARLVICITPSRRRRWTTATLPAEARRRYYELLDRLFANDERSLVGFSDRAASLFSDFFDRHNEEAERLPSAELQSAFSKLEELPARLALILHAAESGTDAISEDVMARAIRVTEWAKDETRRAYAILGSRQPGCSASTRAAPSLPSDEEYVVDWIRRKGSASARKIQSGCRRFRDSAGRAKATLENLVQRGLLKVTADGDYECADANPAAREAVMVAATGADTVDTVDTVDAPTGGQPWTKV
jgi:5S rRNA maturation endonuclease (ribonuclease M5)